MVKPCVKVIADDYLPSSMLNKVIEPRSYVVGNRTIHVYSTLPSPCVFTIGSEIIVRKMREYEFITEGEMFIIHDKSKNDIYIYPRDIVDEIIKIFVEPLKQGKKPYSSGLLLYGAPGTGKSLLAKFMSELTGLPLERFDPDRILSKYIGMSEKNARAFFNKVKSLRTCIVLFDELEWIGLGRRLASAERAEQAHLDVLNIILTEMQEIWDDPDLNVLFVGTTNFKITEIDQALLREGRFGRSYLIPLPTLEMIEYYLRFHGINDKELAIKMVNAGFSMADVHDYVYKLKKGLKPKITKSGGRGYKRYFVEPVNGFEKFFNRFFPREVFKKRSRIWISYSVDVATAIALQLVTHAGMSNLLLTEEKNYDEAVMTANIGKAVLIVPTSMPDYVLRYIDLNAEGAVVFVGERHPANINVFDFVSLNELASWVSKEALVKAVCNYKGIKVSDDVLKKIITHMQTSKVEDILNTISSLSVLDEKFLHLIPT